MLVMTDGEVGFLESLLGQQPVREVSLAWYKSTPSFCSSFFSSGSCGEPIRGTDEVYFENGQLKAKGTYKDGKWHGPYEEYFEDGQLRYKGTFNMGFECDHWIVNGENRSYPRYPPGLEDGN